MYSSFRPLLLALSIAILAVPAIAEDAQVQLVPAKPISKDVAAYPRVAAKAGIDADRINASLNRDERHTRKEIAECKQSQESDYSVDIAVTMKGPRFISYVKNIDYYCGGAHPDTETLALVFDLKSGLMLDWFKFLPASLLTQTVEDRQTDKSMPGTITSKALGDLYRANADRSEKDCNEAMNDIKTFIFWPDAKENGIVFSPYGLAHIDRATCGADVTIPTGKLRAVGMDAAMLDSIQSAHDHGWYDK